MEKAPLANRDVRLGQFPNVTRGPQHPAHRNAVAKRQTHVRHMISPDYPA